MGRVKVKEEQTHSDVFKFSCQPWQRLTTPRQKLADHLPYRPLPPGKATFCWQLECMTSEDPSDAESSLLFFKTSEK